MLAYAANRTGTARLRSSPPAMLGIAVAHIAAIALVMSAKMDIPEKRQPVITKVTSIPLPIPPKPIEQELEVEPKTKPLAVDRIVPVVPIPLDDPVEVVPVPQPPLTGFNTGGGEGTGTAIRPVDPVLPVRIGPRFATPDHALRPPYPRSKIDSGEEAALRLRLSIDARGRVSAVEPVGRADPAFLEAARRHLIARWRYKPATEDGRPVAATTTITLRFELEG